MSYVEIAFFYRKANILCRWSNILCIFNRNKVCLIAADLIKLDENLLHTIVSQFRVLVAVQYMNTQLFTFFCQLATCTCCID